MVIGTLKIIEESRIANMMPASAIMEMQRLKRRACAHAGNDWGASVAGCLAGSVAAALYALHCDESAATFVVSWYTAGILLPGLVGMLIGPRVLR